jgi:hypothetical protein
MTKGLRWVLQNKECFDGPINAPFMLAIPYIASDNSHSACMRDGVRWNKACFVNVHHLTHVGQLSTNDP